jgi:hypothetical protein
MILPIRTLALFGGVSLCTVPVSAEVFTFFGEATPDASIVEGTNGATNAALFTTIRFGGTGWASEDGFLKLTTAPSRGIWFGTSNGGYGDNSGLVLSDTSTGNRFLTTFLLTPGSQSWGFYFFDQDGFGASLQVEETDNGQSRPGVWVSLAEDRVKVSDEFFNPNVLHTFEAHVFDGEVLYRLDGEDVATGAAMPSGPAGLSVIGDGSGSTPTGSGSMWIDYLEIDNAAGAFSLTVIPEANAATALLGLLAFGAVLRRRR